MRRLGFFVLIALCAVSFCGKKDSDAAETVPRNEKLPPKGSASDAPEFIRSLSLIYPQSEIYRVDNRIVQKTNHALRDITNYYEGVFKKQNFSETARLEQTNGALLQYERSEKNTKEMISVDVAKLPYAENYLIRIGRSEVDYSRGKPE